MNKVSLRPIICDMDVILATYVKQIHNRILLFRVFAPGTSMQIVTAEKNFTSVGILTGLVPINTTRSTSQNMRVNALVDSLPYTS